jgi:SAM-dependent methyltransferase
VGDEPSSKQGLYYKASRGRVPEARWEEIQRIADLRSTDSVLDVGCAEGLITLQAAKIVGSIHGIDIAPGRIEAARHFAAEQGIENATFEVASVTDFPLAPASYDVSMFLAVWGKSSGEQKQTGSVGAEELHRVLDATRRQLVMRVSIQLRPRYEALLEEILDVCDQADFDALCFSRVTQPVKRRKAGTAEGAALKPGGNLLIANRRGVDVRTGELPKLVLLPTSFLLDHPVVKSSDAPPTRRTG